MAMVNTKHDDIHDFSPYLLLRGGLRSHSGTWRQHKKEPDCRAAPATSGSSDERLQRRDSLTSGSRESSSQRRETLAASGSRRGSREGSSGRRDSERRTVPSDEGSAVTSGQDNDQEERGDQASVRRERSNSSLRKGSPREESLRRASPREQESLPPVASSGRASRSIENVLSR